MKRLIIVPDQDLQDVAFHALPFPPLGRPLISALEIAYYPSLTMLVWTRGRARPIGPDSSGSILLVESPTIAPALRMSFPELPFSHDEAESVAALYPSPQILNGPDASVGKVAAWLPNAEVVHFAVHAALEGKETTDSGLLLSPDQVAPSGILTKSYLSKLQLRTTRLLVLSGCSTALGLARGRAVLWGLPSAALEAGAQSVLATTTAVYDHDASMFSLEFHRQFVQLRDGVSAYASAAREIWRRNGGKTEVRPSIWASYRLIGG